MWMSFLRERPLVYNLTKFTTLHACSRINLRCLATASPASPKRYAHGKSRVGVGLLKKRLVVRQKVTWVSHFNVSVFPDPEE